MMMLLHSKPLRKNLVKKQSTREELEYELAVAYAGYLQAKERTEELELELVELKNSIHKFASTLLDLGE